MEYDIFTVDAVREFAAEPELPAGAKAILDSAVARQGSLAQAANRAATLLVLTATAMVLLDRSVLQSFDLGPIHITQLSVVQRCLPTFGAYLTYEVWSYSVRYWHADFVVRTINRIYRPSLVARRFASVTGVPAPSTFAPTPEWLITPTGSGKLLRLATNVLRLGYVIAPIGLQALWEVQLFQRYGAQDSLVWLGLCLTVVFIGYAILLAVAAVKVGALRPMAVWGMEGYAKPRIQQP
jgi:hypothetical protein